MFLKSLSIITANGLLRKIVFHKGLNLIVDESKSSTSTKKSGNNLGKTTILRLINFCLGGDPKSIYQDPEFKDRVNKKVQSFLVDEKVVIKLVLKEDLSLESSRETTIRRNFLQRKDKLQELDSCNYSNNDEFDLALKRRIFNFSGAKPTFSQIRSRNIRDDAERLENTVKVLGKFCRAEEYEALYLFWLGVPHPDAENKRRLLEEKRVEDQLLRRLRRENDESKIVQFLAILQADIDALEARKNTFNLNETYQDDLAGLVRINAQLNELSAVQSQLELRKELIEESRRDLESDSADAQTHEIAALYAQAKALIPSLQKTYEETVAFHNKMLVEKVRYITKELPRIDAKVSEIKHAIQQALVAERRIKEKLKKVGIVEELQPIIAELNSKYEQKGRLTEQADQIRAAKGELNRIDAELEIIDIEIANLDALIQSRVKIFNFFFSAISDVLYGEKFALSAPHVEMERTGSKFYQLHIDSLSGRPGTGKKKGEIAAFDIAFVKFSEEMKLPCLHFILHDQLEVVDHNQIIGLRNEAVKANCQFIVPILRDKLPAELNRPEYQVISLSEEDKLFRI